MRIIMTSCLVTLCMASVVLALAHSGNAARAQTPTIPLAEPAPGRIVYTRGADGVIDIFTAAPDGSDELRLSDIEESSAGEYQPRFSPDGTRVVFATTDANGLATYWIIPATGGEPSPVVARDGQGLDPTWSPDGHCIAFSGSHLAGGAPTPDRHDIKIWCDDAPVRTLTDTPSIDEREADWSPDGMRIAFAARVVGSSSNRWRLESIAVDGTDRRVLLERGVHDRQPRYAPDGERLAFVASDLSDLPIGTLSLLDPTTGIVSPLVRRPAASFAWSPDGSELLFGNIDNDRVDVVGSGSPLAALDLASPAGLQAATAKGLYRVVVGSLALSRLKGAAGGAESTPNSYDFGFAPDWSAGPATPTPVASDTPKATATSALTATATASATRRATATPSSTPTSHPGTRAYFPIALDVWSTESSTPTPTTQP